MKMRKLLAAGLLLLLFVGILAGCSAEAPGEADDRGVYDKSENSMAVESANTSLSGTQTSSAMEVPQNQKLIRTVYLDAETETMDDLLAAVEQRIGELEGYVENREVYNGSSYNSSRSRYANLTIRIPADRLDEFVNHVSQVSNITSNRESAEDVTLDYVATQSRIVALETEQTRLLELLAKAENMEDLLLIESRLTDVREELERVNSQLRVYDNLVNYATIHLDISEVRQYTVVEEEPETVWERISSGFMKSLKGLGNGITEIFVFLVVALPYLAVIALVGAGIILLLKGRRKKNIKKPIQTDLNPKNE